MEKRDLYDKDKNLTGKTIYKNFPIPKGYYILVVLIFIQNSEGKFLIQKRSKLKNGKFATTGGHPKAGETSIEGAITEVKEEIGLDISKQNMKLFYSGRSDTARVFCDDYYIKMDVPDIENLKLQKSEVDSVYWFSTDEIKKLMQEGKFFASHYDDFEILLNKGSNSFLETKISDNIREELTESTVLDLKNNEFIEDDVLKNKILFAYVWYIINYNYNMLSGKKITIEQAFDKKSFLNYFLLIKSVIYLNNNNSFSPNILYYIISTENLMLEYFVNSIFLKNNIQINNNELNVESNIIYKSINIFYNYLEVILKNKNGLQIKKI